MEDVDLLCKFCNASNQGKYTCPRCNQRYCSSECYKSQSHAACSESFYRECFMEGLQDMVVNGEERNKVAEMLRRLEDEHPSETVSSDSESEDLADRMSGIDLDHETDKIWRRLTSGERQEFERMLNDGSIADLVPLWTPWWITGGRLLVEDISEQCRPCSLPEMLKDVPELGKLAKSGGVVDSSLVSNIINVLFGYAYVARLYNGDHLDLASESAQVLLDVSGALDRGVYPDPAMAIGGCIAQLDGGAAQKHFISVEYSYAVVNDVCRIIGRCKSNEFALAALSECHRIFSRARREIGKDDKVMQRRYQVVEKKLEFFVSWTSSDACCVLLSTLPTVEMESCRLLSELVTYQTKHSQVEKAMDLMRRQKEETASRPLITEIATSDVCDTLTSDS